MVLVQVLEIVAFHYSCTILAVVVVAGCVWSIWVPVAFRAGVGLFRDSGRGLCICKDINGKIQGSWDLYMT